MKLIDRTDSDSLVNELNSIFRIFGKSDLIVSDNGPPFNSQAFVDYARLMKIELKKSPTRSPESNGLAERGVQTAKNASNHAHIWDLGVSGLQKYALKCLQFASP